MASSGPAARTRRDDWFIAAALAALAGLLAAGGFTWRADRLLYDIALGFWRQPAPADVAIIAIDDASVAAIGRWPWRRAVHATLLERIGQARPRAVLLDLVLSEPDPDPRQDELLAAALRRAAPVVLPVAWQSQSAPDGSSAGGLVPQALEPLPALRAATQLGMADAAVDEDGVLRHAFLEAGPVGDVGRAGLRYPHVALALLRAGGQDLAPGSAVQQEAPAPGARRAGWQSQGRLLLRFVGPPGSFERISYVDVLAGRVDPARLRGRYLLIGLTAQGLGDTLATPVNASAPAMPGIEVLANVLHTLRSGEAIAEASPQALAAASALGAALLVLALPLAGARRALPLALGAPLLALLASFAAVGAGLQASAVPFALAVLPAYPLWSWRRLEAAMRGLDAQLQRLAHEPLLQREPAGRAPDPIAARLRLLEEAVATVQGAERFIAATLEQLPQATLVADARGRVLLGNARAAQLFEVGSAEELQGLDLPRLLGEFRTAQAIDWARWLEATAPEHPRSLEVALPGQGDFVLHLGHAELHGQACRVVALADVRLLKDAQRRREETLAFVSHDLRSPSAAIVMLSQLQQQGRAPPSLGEPGAFAAEVQRLAQRALAMADDFVREAQARERPLQCSRVPLAELVEHALAELRPQALAAGIALQVEAEAGEVALDRWLVERALANLVSNALKHSPRAATVSVHAGHWADGRGSGLELRVEDAGAGLSEAQLAQLRSGQEGAAVGDARGVGLGLRFVQQVARRHGGALLAERRGEGGTRMRLRLRDTPGEVDSGNP